ncbi:MAG: hypothetical protein AAGA15_14885 [Pseudomonadota bacterium]
MTRAFWAVLLLASCGARADLEVVDGAPPEGAIEAVEAASADVPLLPGDGAASEPVAEPERGFFGRLLERGRAAEATSPEGDASVQEVASPSPRRGVLGGIFGGGSVRGGDDGQVSLAYGDIVPACGTERGALGKEVARYPERGGGYRIYDTNPTTISLREHYITGFKDGCPRKFLAALAIFGGPQIYEATRENDEDHDTNLTNTDLEYRTIRARVCGAPPGQTCPARRFARLERDAVFVSVYERFGTNPTWADLLIYDGEVVAKDFKTVR